MSLEVLRVVHGRRHSEWRLCLASLSVCFATSPSLYCLNSCSLKHWCSLKYKLCIRRIRDVPKKHLRALHCGRRSWVWLLNRVSKSQAWGNKFLPIQLNHPLLLVLATDRLHWTNVFAAANNSWELAVVPPAPHLLLSLLHPFLGLGGVSPRLASIPATNLPVEIG